MLLYYALKISAEQLNIFKVEGNGVTPREKFAGKMADITFKIQHT